MKPKDLAKSNTEHAHQRAFFAFVNYARVKGFAQAYAWAELEAQASLPDDRFRQFLERHVYAIPNGASYGANSKAEGARMKAEGLKPGVSDVFVAIPVKKYAGLYMEFKKPALMSDTNHYNGCSEKQKLFLFEAVKLGYAACVPYSYEQAIEYFTCYLKGVFA